MPEKKKGRYHNDYSPRYKEQYDIYDKAREHMKRQKQKDRRSDGLSLIKEEHSKRGDDNYAVSDET